MPGRPHAERLRNDLDEIRNDLVKTVQDLTPDELSWAPAPGMRSFKDLLQEIGTMELLCRHMAQHQEELDWNAVWATLDKPDIASIVSALTGIREETLAYLSRITEEQLETPVPLSQEWQGYFRAPVVEPEELMRWVVRHEYYHLGQIITYQWQRGKNPYEEK